MTLSNQKLIPCRGPPDKAFVTFLGFVVSQNLTRDLLEVLPTDFSDLWIAATLHNANLCCVSKTNFKNSAPL